MGMRFFVVLLAIALLLISQGGSTMPALRQLDGFLARELTTATGEGNFRWTLWLALAGGAWALFSFGHARRVKTGELLTQLENGVNTSLATLLRIEDSAAYAENLVLPLLKSLAATNDKCEPPASRPRFAWRESLELQRLEAALRHLHICWHIRGSGSHARAIDEAYGYYLRLIVSDQRPELRDYVRQYWSNLYVWGKRLEGNMLASAWLALKYTKRRAIRRVLGEPVLLSRTVPSDLSGEVDTYRKRLEVLPGAPGPYDSELAALDRIGGRFLRASFVLGLIALAIGVARLLVELVLLVAGSSAVR